MVSKAKKSNHHTLNRRRKKNTPITSASKTASVVVSSINKSIYTCRRLIKIFSKLVRIATPTRKSSVKKGYKILHKFPGNHPIASARKSLFQDPVPNSLPPLIFDNKKTVFLDLDETLIHSVPASGLIRPRHFDFVVNPLLDGDRVTFYVTKRPFVDEFLKFLHEKGFEIVIFTAGIEEYASLVLDTLDRDGLISYRLYRNSCTEIDGRFVKDLSNLGRDLKKGVIVDDNPNSYGLQPENAIPIKPFVDDDGDDELKKLMSGFFMKCDEFEDLRDAVKDYVGIGGEGVEDLKSVKKLIEDEVFGDNNNNDNNNNIKDSKFQALIEV